MCKVSKHLVFCHCEAAEAVIHHKKSKRWQKKNPVPLTYRWTISRFVGHFQSMMEGLMSEPSEKLDKELSSDWLLAEINARNCFDFDYIPLEGDNLTIRRSDSWHFFSYLFRNGQWQMGMYNCFSDKTEDVDEGVLKLNKEEEV